MKSVGVDSYIVIVPTSRLVALDKEITDLVSHMSELLGNGYFLLSASGDGIGNVQYFFSKPVINEGV